MLSLTAAVIRKIVIQSLSFVRLACLYKVGTISLAAVGIKRKLRNYKKLAAYISKRKIYLVILVGKNTQIYNLICKSAAILLSIPLPYSKKHKIACADLSADISINGYAGGAYSLQYYSHFYFLTISILRGASSINSASLSFIILYIGFGKGIFTADFVLLKKQI